MGRAYGQRPSDLLGVVAEGPTFCLMLDAAAHALGGHKLSGVQAFPTIDLGAF